MTETLREAPTLRIQEMPLPGVDQTELTQILEDADAAAATATAAAVKARARADRLRRQAQSATKDASDDADQDCVAEADAPSTAAGRDAPSDDDYQIALPDAATTSSTGRRRWPKFVRAAVVAALVSVAGAANGRMLWEHQTAVRQRQITAEFVAAARQAIVTLMSMDFQHSKEDFKRLVDDSTGEFRDDFTRRAEDFTTAIEQSKVVTTAKVNSVAVQSMTADSATVLVAATSEVTNAAGALREPRAWRLIVTVKRDGGLLKMSRVEFVP
jgi:Mce-associated membrane protein